MGNNQTEKEFKEKRLAETIKAGKRSGRQKEIRNYQSQKRCA